MASVIDQELAHLCGLFAAHTPIGGSKSFGQHPRAQDCRIWLRASQTSGEFAALINKHDKMNGSIPDAAISRINRDYAIAPIGLVTRHHDRKRLIDAIREERTWLGFAKRFEDVLSSADKVLAVKAGSLLTDASEIAPIFAMEVFADLYPDHHRGLRDIIKSNGGLDNQRLLDVVSREQMVATHKEANRRAAIAWAVAGKEGVAA